MIPTPPPHAVALTKLELYETFRRNGFPHLQAETMGAIALRESRGIPDVHNLNPATGDDSLGLVQINLADKLVAAAMEKNGITREMLLTADGNAKGAYILWGGNNANLNVAWYIWHMDVKKRPDGTVVKNPDGTPVLVPSAYKLQYESHLAEIHAAALQSTLA